MLMSNTHCNCDNCKKSFTVKPRIAYLKNAIHKTFFVCPHCGKQYTAFYTDPRIRKLQKGLRQNVPEDHSDFVDARNNIHKLMVELRTTLEG